MNYVQKTYKSNPQGNINVIFTPTLKGSGFHEDLTLKKERFFPMCFLNFSSWSEKKGNPKMYKGSRNV